MRMEHLLIECFCDCENFNEELPCIRENHEIGIHCLEKSCHYFSYTKCPNELAYVNENGVVENEEDSIGFGGDMIIENDDTESLIIEWGKICKNKIAEAYDEYMYNLRKNKKGL